MPISPILTGSAEAEGRTRADATVAGLAGWTTLASALWWALISIGMHSKGVYFESAFWMAVCRALPFVCLIPAAGLLYVFLRGGFRNPAIFLCGFTAGLLPLAAWLAQIIPDISR